MGSAFWSRIQLKCMGVLVAGIAFSGVVAAGTGDSCSGCQAGFPLAGGTAARNLGDAAALSNTFLPADPDATAGTRVLLANLHRGMGNGILFGQHDAPLYGLNADGSSWSNDGVHDTDRSDIRTATGSHGAMVGFDLREAIRSPNPGGSSAPGSGSPEARARLLREVGLAYRRGQMVTMSWHAPDPITGEGSDSYQRSGSTGPNRVTEILRPGPVRDSFLRSLDDLADFFLAARTPEGTPIPIVFRPFHEQIGNWFWWGASHCTPEQFSELWRLTIEHLRVTRGVHNLLIAYSPNQTGNTAAEYLRGYPGDSFVDVLGLDAYHQLDTEEGARRTGRDIGDLVRLARSRGKVAALTETGLEAFRIGPYEAPTRRGEPNNAWFTRNLGLALRSDPDASEISYAMVWRNATPSHHYFPPPSNPEATADFLRFRTQSHARLLNDLGGSLYSASGWPAQTCPQ